jgi:hypothetical protein
MIQVKLVQKNEAILPHGNSLRASKYWLFLETALA